MKRVQHYPRPHNELPYSPRQRKSKRYIAVLLTFFYPTRSVRFLNNAGSLHSHMEQILRGTSVKALRIDLAHLVPSVKYGGGCLSHTVFKPCFFYSLSFFPKRRTPVWSSSTACSRARSRSRRQRATLTTGTAARGASATPSAAADS